MKNTIKAIITLMILIAVWVWSYNFINNDTNDNYHPTNSSAVINLYGEAHGIKEFYDLELEEWGKCYAAGMRDLFVEVGFSATQYLNMYMKDDTDVILYQLYDDLERTSQHTQLFIDFYSSIKELYPETIFHGTDIDHQYNKTGVRYLKYLEENGMKDSEEYKRTMENMEQGRIYSEELNYDDEYRETKMVENFISDFDRLESGKTIMGIYGGYHIDINDSSVMAGRLREHYGDIIAIRYMYNFVITPEPYKIGFSITGLIFLLMLFIPNIIFGMTITDEIKATMAQENKVLGALERIGQVLCTVSLLGFAGNDPRILYRSGICLYFPKGFQWFVIAVILMIMYEIYWIRYFVSKKTPANFYSSLSGIPYAGATLPCLAILCIGLSSGNLVVIISGIILSIGHIGIHKTNYK